jgi:hypothetical protein
MNFYLFPIFGSNSAFELLVSGSQAKALTFDTQIKNKKVRDAREFVGNDRVSCLSRDYDNNSMILSGFYE